MPKRKLITFRNPALSLWQSALHDVLARRVKTAREIPGHPAMKATAKAGLALLEPEAKPESQPESAPPHHGIDDCAHLFARWALGRFHGDHDEAVRLESELRYQDCDPLWAETVAEYERSLLRRQHAPYVRHTSPDDFVLAPLPDKATIALIADWGTGMPDARALLEQVRMFGPDVLIHLGDIYYSGTHREVLAHFLSPIREVFGERMPRVLTLSGNHDRYSGGAGYYELLAQLGQPASYFCLRNDWWQLVAMDTGLHDRNPRRVHGDLTYLEPSEAEWIVHQLRNGGSRSSILLSHHPLFSIQGAGHVEGTLVAANPRLQQVFAEFVGELAWWFWGHEHDLLVYQPYVGLRRGRCVGAGAVPRLVGQEIRTPPSGLVLPAGHPTPPVLIPGTEIGNNGVVDDHVFAILELDGPRATTRYYQTDSSDLIPGRVPAPGPPLFTEDVVR